MTDKSRVDPLHVWRRNKLRTKEDFEEAVWLYQEGRFLAKSMRPVLAEEAQL